MLSSELERLHQLRQSGALSEHELQQARQRILQGTSVTGQPGVGREEMPSTTSPAPGSGQSEKSPLVCGMKPQIWLSLMHASQLLTYTVLGTVVPVIMWLVSRDESKEADQHGRVIINWMLSWLIYAAISGILCLVAIGIPMLVVLTCFSVVFPVIGAIQAARGVQWKYPLSINFFGPAPE